MATESDIGAPPAEPAVGEKLDDELAALLEVERFEPPAGFRERALLNDPAVYERAARDPQAWWVEQARALHWFKPWDRVLDDSNPPFYKWFVGGELNVSYNCLDRHVEAGLGERVAFHWRGEDGDERDITYAELLAEVQRFANALKDLGVGKGDVVGIYLPMIPEVVVAMLACARIGAPHNVVFGGFSAEAVRERMEFSQAKVLITVDGAARKGKTAPVKDRVDEVMGDLQTLEKIVVVRSKGTPCEMQEGRDVYYDEILAAADPDCPAEPLDAEHPLYILYTSGSTAKPKGILHTTGGYLTGVSATHRYVFDLKAGDRRLLVRRRRRLGHRATPTSSTGRCANGATSVMWEGAPDYPHKGIWWELVERYGVTHPVLRADGDPRVHQVGRAVAERARPLDAAAARLGRRADQPEGVALVPQGDRPRTLPDRRHLVADRDGRDHDHAAAGDHRHQARLGDAARSPGCSPRCATSPPASRSRRARACSC